jgi:hypothetical protein
MNGVRAAPDCCRPCKHELSLVAGKRFERMCTVSLARDTGQSCLLRSTGSSTCHVSSISGALPWMAIHVCAFGSHKCADSRCPDMSADSSRHSCPARCATAAAYKLAQIAHIGLILIVAHAAVNTARYGVNPARRRCRSSTVSTSDSLLKRLHIKPVRASGPILVFCMLRSRAFIAPVLEARSARSRNIATRGVIMYMSRAPFLREYSGYCNQCGRDKALTV